MFYVREADRADGPQGSLATEIGHVGPRVAVRALADAVDVLLRQAVHLIRHQVHDDLLAGLGVFRRTEIILKKIFNYLSSSVPAMITFLPSLLKINVASLLMTSELYFLA